MTKVWWTHTDVHMSTYFSFQRWQIKSHNGKKTHVQEVFKYVVGAHYAVPMLCWIRRQLALSSGIGPNRRCFAPKQRFLAQRVEAM